MCKLYSYNVKYQEMKYLSPKSGNSFIKVWVADSQPHFHKINRTS